MEKTCQDFVVHLGVPVAAAATALVSDEAGLLLDLGMGLVVALHHLCSSGVETLTDAADEASLPDDLGQRQGFDSPVLPMDQLGSQSSLSFVS